MDAESDYQSSSLAEMGLSVLEPIEKPWSGTLNERDLQRLILQALDGILKKTGTLVLTDEEGHTITIQVTHGKLIKSLPISTNTTPYTTVLPAKPGVRYCVVAYAVQLQGTALFQWIGEDASLTGIYSFQNREGMSQSIEAPSFLFATEYGHPLMIYLSAAVQCAGLVTYFEESA